VKSQWQVFWLVSYQPPVQLMQPWMEHGVFFARIQAGEHAWHLPGSNGHRCFAWEAFKNKLAHHEPKSVQRLHSCLGRLMWLFFVVSMFGLQMRGSYAILTKDLMDLDLAGFKMNTGPFRTCYCNVPFRSLSGDPWHVLEPWEVFFVDAGFHGGSSASWRFLFWLIWSDGFNMFGIRIKYHLVMINISPWKDPPSLIAR